MTVRHRLHAAPPVRVGPLDSYPPAVILPGDTPCFRHHVGPPASWARAVSWEVSPEALGELDVRPERPPPPAVRGRWVSLHLAGELLGWAPPGHVGPEVTSPAGVSLHRPMETLATVPVGASVVVRVAGVWCSGVVGAPWETEGAVAATGGGVTLTLTAPGDVALAARELLATSFVARERGLGEREARGLESAGAEGLTLRVSRSSGLGTLRVNITDDRGAPLARLTWEPGGTWPFFATGPARVNITREGSTTETVLPSLPSPSELTVRASGGRVTWSLGGREVLSVEHPQRPARVVLSAEGGPDTLGVDVAAGWDG